MNILELLVKLANDLDAKGLFNEANFIDKVAQEVSMQTEPGKTTYNFPEDVLEPLPKGPMNFPEDVIRSTPASRKRMMLVNQIRKEVGLPPGIFDRQLAMRLKQYPGVWRPGTKQKAGDVLALLQKAKEVEVARNERGIANQVDPMKQIMIDTYNDPRKPQFDIRQAPEFRSRFPNLK